MSRAGFQAYAAYCLAINPRSKPSDAWRTLPQQFKDAWSCAAYAVDATDEDRDEDDRTISFEVVDDDTISDRVVKLPDEEHPIGVLGGSRRGLCFTANGARLVSALLTKGLETCPPSSLN